VPLLICGDEAAERSRTCAHDPASALAKSRKVHRAVGRCNGSAERRTSLTPLGIRNGLAPGPLAFSETVSVRVRSVTAAVA